MFLLPLLILGVENFFLSLLIPDNLPVRLFLAVTIDLVIIPK